MKKTSPEKNKYKIYSVTYIEKSSGGVLINSNFIENILLEAKRVNKKPLVIIDIKRNDNERILLEITVNIKKDKK